MLNGLKKIYKNVKIDGKNIIINFCNTSLKSLQLFLMITTAAKKGKNKTTCSHNKQIMGATKNICALIILLSYFF